MALYPELVHGALTLHNDLNNQSTEGSSQEPIIHDLKGQSG